MNQDRGYMELQSESRFNARNKVEMAMIYRDELFIKHIIIYLVLSHINFDYPAQELIE